MLFPTLTQSPSLTLGTFGAWPFTRTLRLPVAQAGTHLHIMGVTGSGKSRFLAWLFLELRRHGLPATLLDPHGDLAELVLRQLVARRVYAGADPDDADGPYRRILYLDIPRAAAAGRYLPLNVLRQPGDHDAIADNILDAFHRAWPALGDGRAPRLDKLVLHGVKLLLSNDLPLPYLDELLTNDHFRRGLYARERDANVLGFWRGWYDRLSERLRFEYSESTSSRITLLTFNRVLRYSLLQRENSFDFRRIMDAGTSLIVNLHIPGTNAQRLLGCFLTVLAEKGAASRGEIAAGHRGGTHHLIMDEATLFSAQSSVSLRRILSECRKFGLFLGYGHQNWDQNDEHLQGALQNVGVEVLLAQGDADAERSARMLTRVDPRTVRRAAEEGGDESVGMREQWEQMKQELKDQWQGDAYISIHTMTRPRWFTQRLLRLTPWRTWKVRLPHLPNPRVDERQLAAVRERYLARFRHVEDIETRREERSARAFRAPAVRTPLGKEAA